MSFIVKGIRICSPDDVIKLGIIRSSTGLIIADSISWGLVADLATITYLLMRSAHPVIITLQAGALGAAAVCHITVTRIHCMTLRDTA